MSVSDPWTYITTSGTQSDTSWSVNPVTWSWGSPDVPPPDLPPGTEVQDVRITLRVRDTAQQQFDIDAFPNWLSIPGFIYSGVETYRLPSLDVTLVTYHWKPTA